MLRKLSCVLLVSLLACLVFAQGCSAQQAAAPVFAPEPAPVFRVLPEPLPRGNPGRVMAEGLPSGASVSGTFDGKPIFFYDNKGVLVGLFGADVMIKPGAHPLSVSWKTAAGAGGTERLDVSVVDKSYGVRDVKVPQSQVDLSAEDLERARVEREQTSKALATRSPERLWSGEFLEPVNGRINSSFGRQTRFNGILNPRPHAGADYLVGEGTPVSAPADGRVILTGDHFFAGNSVYIDHGQGLVSMFFHLSRIDAVSGRDIKKGETLGLVGKTGRVSGAHLHYGLYINGARIDPPVFRQMTATLAGDNPNPAAATRAGAE
ncbi:MAG: M23 family metallopeptidase [Deltaproteobacteria bacterium]|jgi:hypothetical protein|nr:M23 family metallopeptidase [Deltaproteobacteria bacterium]